jgi:hypothetical protein
VKRAALLLLSACTLSPDVLYLCETDGGCFQSDHLCQSDGYCHPSNETGGGGGSAMGGGAAMGGGSAAGGGSAIGGGSAMGGGAAGGSAMGGGSATGGGATGGGGNDGGCIPKSCPGLGVGIFDCGTLDDGCGHTVYCGHLPDSGIPDCTPQTFCGAGIHANVCEAPISCSNGWCWENPLPQGNTLRGVWATDAEQWAVGDVGTLLHFNGQYWKLAPSPTRSNLNAIAGIGAADLWAAGDDGVILHYDGVTWSIAHVDPGHRFKAIAESATGEVVAGGTNHVIDFKNGTWNDITNTLALDVNALRILPSGVVIAGGAGSTPAWQHDSVGWSQILSPGIHEIDALLVTSTGEVFAGANTCQIARLLLGSFVSFTGGNGCDAGILALAGTSEGDLIGAGDGFAIQFDGGGVGGAAAGTWRGACARDAGAVTLVGDNGLLAHTAQLGGAVVLDSSGTSQGDVTSLSATAAGDVFAGSEQGAVLLRKQQNRAASWHPIMGVVGPDRVTAVYASSLTDIWGVTATGIIGQSSGGNFVVAQVADQAFNALAHHLNHLELGGSDGGIFRIDDGNPPDAVIAVQVPTQVTTLGSTTTSLFSDGARLWAVTQDGQLLECDNGRTFMADLPVTPDGLRAVHGAPGFVIAAGPDGGVFTGRGLIDGGNIDIAFSPAGTQTNFNGAFAWAPHFAWLVGDQGTALLLDGGAWQAIPPPTANDLLAVTGTADGGLFVAGKRGVLLFRP